MAKIGRFVTIPTGSYCTITLDSGEKLVVNHEQGPPGLSSGGRLTIDRLKLMGFSSETIVQIDLDAAEGKATLAALTKGRTPAASASPLGVFVSHIEGCASVGEVVARCRQLLQGG